MSKTQRTVAWQELMQKYTGMRKKFVWLWQRRKFCSAAFWKHQKATELRARWCAWALYNLNVYKNHYVFTSQSLMCSTDIIVLLKTDRHEFIASLLWRNNTVFVASQYNSALTQWFHIFWCHKADFVKTKCVTIQQDNWLQSRFTLRGFKFFHSIFKPFCFYSRHWFVTVGEQSIKNVFIQHGEVLHLKKHFSVSLKRRLQVGR